MTEMDVSIGCCNVPPILESEHMVKSAQSMFEFDDVSSTASSADFGDIEALYKMPLPASRTGALYNAFSYPTKISPEAIAIFLATHTSPGGTVLDTFSGSGTTGLAAKLCDRPTANMLKMAKEMGLHPEWGPRNAHLVDVGSLGCFMSGVMTNPPEPEAFRQAVEKLLSTARAELHGLYEATDTQGRPGQIRHVIWSDVIACPNCSVEHRLWDLATQRDPAKFLSEFECPSCSKTVKLDTCKRVTKEQDDIFGVPKAYRLRVPVEVHGQTNGKNWRRPASDCDEHLTKWQEFELPQSAPRRPIKWGELYRAGYHGGIEELHDFYTPRNFLAVSKCMEIAGREPEPMASALRFLVLSYNASHSTLMTRIVAKKSQKDFVLTGAQSGVLYVSGLPVEKNVLQGVERKAKVISNAFDLIYGSRSTVSVHHCSSEDLPLDDHTVDYVFTDPPFGDYIPYAEINQINELWLDEVTRREDETVISKSGGKDVEHYQASMTAVFEEVERVLKPSGMATVVFHSAQSRIWQALCTAYSEAGLRVRQTSVLDKIQASFKQVVSIVSVKGDPLILLEKGAQKQTARMQVDVFLEVLRNWRNSLPEDERAMFSDYIAKSIAAGQPIDLGMAEFSRRLRSVLAEADAA